MSMINYASREINCKLVYYGPGLGGKTTNLEFVYNKVAPGSRGKMISLATETERTLFFDFLPVDLGDRKSTRLNSSHVEISYAVFCLKKKKKMPPTMLTLSGVAGQDPCPL